jgi:hypothetical protein
MMDYKEQIEEGAKPYMNDIDRGHGVLNLFASGIANRKT